MKHLPKITLVFMFVSMFFVTSCGGDEDETAPDLSDVAFTFDVSNPPIDETVITNLQSSGDPNALQISSQLGIANLMTIWLGFFQDQPDAVTSTTPIGTCGGSALVYTYTLSDGIESFSVAYQICETSDKYIFQIFVSENGADFDLFLYAEESKGDLRQGLMQIYSPDPSSSTAGTEVFFEYTWTENADGSFDFTVSDAMDGFLIEISINADNSGSISFQLDGQLSYEATWDSTGTSGTFVTYDNGVETGSGNWPS